MVVLPDSPISGTIVITFGTYVVGLKSASPPTSCQPSWTVFSKIGPRAKPSAGSPAAAVATPPAASAPPVTKRLRVIVSPSNAPRTPRSLVYGERFFLLGSATKKGYGFNARGTLQST